MLKFNRANSHDLYNGKPKRKHLSAGVSLDSPKNISLESLQALVEQEHEELEPPPRISLESLRRLVPKKAAAREANSVFHVSPEASCLENLQQLVESSSQLIPVQSNDDPRISTRNLLKTNSSNSGKLRVWKIESGVTETTQSLENLSQPFQPLEANSRSLEQILSAVTQSKPKSKAESRPKVNAPVAAAESTVAVPSKPQMMIDGLRELIENPESLEKWIASLNLPQEMDIPQIRAKIKEFLRNKSWEKHFAGHIRDVTKDSLAERLWNGFKEMSVIKQILVIIGLSILVAAVGFVTIHALSLLWPSVLGLASSGEAAIVEIGIEAFKQRQEPAFHLLLSHAEQAKPMSYAWANQYILWKYVR